MARTLTIKRNRHLLMKVLCPMEVILDGERIGMLKNGQTDTWEMSDGKHQLTINIKDRVSRGCSVVIPEGGFSVSLTADFRNVNATSDEVYIIGVDGKLPWWYPRSEIDDPIKRAQTKWESER